jgi:hypothetical protein
MGRGILRRLRAEKGQSFVEFTLVLPIALVLILGVVDLGRATSYWLDSSHLANEGARAAAVQSCPPAPPPTPGCVTPSDPSGLPQALWLQGEAPQLRDNLTVCIWDLHPAIDPVTLLPDPLAGQPRADGDPWVKDDEIRVTVASTFKFIPFLNLADRRVTGRSSMRLEANWNPSPATNPYGWTFQSGNPSGQQAFIGGTGDDHCPSSPS